MDEEIHERLEALEAAVTRLSNSEKIAGEMFEMFLKRFREDLKSDACAEADSAVLIALLVVLRTQPHVRQAVEHALEKKYAEYLQTTLDEEMLDHFQRRAEDLQKIFTL